MFALGSTFLGSAAAATAEAAVEKPLVVVVASYNNKDYYEKNLDSIFSQSYKNFRVIYTDDFSPDGTGGLVESYVQKHQLDDRMIVIKNKKRKGALYNYYMAIHSCHDDEIVLTVDGDDWLSGNNVFNTINNAYQNDNVWLTYGQYRQYPAGKRGHCRPFPPGVIQNNGFRFYSWISSQLRTFYAGLFKQIKHQDLYHGGEFFPIAYDVAMMMPLLEMAGERHKFIPQVLYIYNRETPINDDKVDGRNKQRLYDRIARKKPRYSRLAQKTWGVKSASASSRSGSEDS